MKTKTLLRACSLIGFASLAILSQAQYRPQVVSTVAATATTASNGAVRHQIQIGDELVYPDGRKITVTADTQLVDGQIGQVRTMKDGKPETFTFKAKAKAEFNFAIYPLTGFTIGGPIVDSNSNELTSGTTTVFGNVLSVARTVPIGNKERSIELGLFYFSPYESEKFGDVYQISATFMQSLNWGIQLAYINSLETPGASASYQAVYKFSSRQQNPNITRGWDIMMGAGLLSNFTDFRKDSSSGLTARSSINFTTFSQISLSLDKSTQLVGSYWYIRDRNSDVGRFGLGVNFRF